MIKKLIDLSYYYRMPLQMNSPQLLFLMIQTQRTTLHQQDIPMKQSIENTDQYCKRKRDDTLILPVPTVFFIDGITIRKSSAQKPN